MATVIKRPDVNKHRLHRILVATLAVLIGSGALWSGCLQAGVGAASHAVQALPSHCEGMEAHHAGEGHSSADCASACPECARGPVLGEALVKAEKPLPDLPPLAAAGHHPHPLAGVATIPGRRWPSGAAPPVLPVTLVQLRVLLLD